MEQIQEQNQENQAQIKNDELVQATPQLLNQVQPIFNPNKKLKRSVFKKLRSRQMKGVLMSYQGTEAIVKNMEVLLENGETLKEELVNEFYTNLPPDWVEDNDLVEKLYLPIEKLDPLKKKALESGKLS
jgi:hypothetical protein